MRRSSFPVFAVLLSLSMTVDVAQAQPNLRPGTDVELGILGTAVNQGHIGSFPNGEMALSMATTSCNAGSVNVPWLAAMNPDHPFIAFMATRETAGRMVQISNRSFLKHGFFALSNSQCTPCQNSSNGTFLGVGCSDTYSVQNNANNDFLAPADEVDPWTGAWAPVCSFFDQGQPPVNPPNDCNGIKSNINPPDSLGNRVRIQDVDLDSPGSTFYYQAHYVIIGEPEADRENNLASRRMVPNWTGSQWQISVPSSGNAQVQGSILRQWTGATVNSVTNGLDDGRVYLAYRTQDNGNGTHRYEYAIHNRDNDRGIKSLRIPVPAGVTLTNVGFHDVDDDAGNDWSFTQSGTEAVFSTTTNPVRWNTIYNVWFDADAAPSSCDLATMEQFDAGPGAPSMMIDAISPGGAMSYGTSEICSFGTFAVMGTSGGAPEVNTSTFAVTVSGANPSSFTFMLSGDSVGNNPVAWGTIIVAGPNFIRTTSTINGAGEGAVHVPVTPSMVGTSRYFQYVTRDPGFGGNLQASNGLKVTFCP